MFFSERPKRIINEWYSKRNETTTVRLRDDTRLPLKDGFGSVASPNLTGDMDCTVGKYFLLLLSSSITAYLVWSMLGAVNSRSHSGKKEWFIVEVLALFIDWVSCYFILCNHCLVELNLRGGTWIRKIHGFPQFSPLILEVWWFHSFEELNQNSKALFRISQRILGFLDMLLIAQKRIIILWGEQSELEISAC